MFGYIKPYTPELKVKEHEMYRATYCGLCKCMGKVLSPLSRLTLSYDATFLALVRVALTDQKISISPKRCFLNPFKKRAAMDSNPELVYCAKVFAILNYYNVKDKLKDKDISKKIAAGFLLPLASIMRRKAKDLEEIEKAVKGSLDELDQIEKENSPSPDRAAHNFGQLLSYILSYGLENKVDAAKEIGLNTGRFIYIADAVEDYEKDIKTSDYNPFAAMKKTPVQESEKIEHSLLLYSRGVYAGAVMTECENPIIAALIENVAEYGMPDICDRIMKNLKKGEENYDRPV